ncbi:MAG: winged helix-turn-helix transcriptional regulator [Geodermatophilaceae bacterium]|nr:winged helix-turn-helix transcriptional regulator [Geodermatophilaceae bacterium]
MPTAKQMSQVVLAGEIRLHLLQRTATTALRTLALTPLEFDLLAYFVAHIGEALSRDRLLENVWGYDIGGRDTVTVHIRRLRQKIEADPSRPTLLQTVWGIGYRLNPNSIPGPGTLQTFGPDTATLAQQRTAGGDA